MFSRLPVIVLLAITLAATIGCSRSREIQQAPAEVIYNEALRNLERGNYEFAIAYLEHLEARFPFSNQARQAQLDLIYAYYRNRENESVIDAAQQFMRENPTHPRVDYALYMQGVALFEPTPGRFERLLRVDLSERPPMDAERSYAAFQELVQRFPDSEYVPDARDRMLYLRNRLADYEIYVARWYIRRGAYVAALNRARNSLETYAGAPNQREALEVMLEAYERLGLRDLADDTREVLAANWPGSY